MVSLQMEVFHQDPWGLAIVYLDAEGRKCLTGYRLSKLVFATNEDHVDIESPSCGICEKLCFLRVFPHNAICSVLYFLILLIGISGKVLGQSFYLLVICAVVCGM